MSCSNESLLIYIRLQRQYQPHQISLYFFGIDFAYSYVDQLGSADDIDPTAAPPLVCLIEEPKGGMGIDERVTVSLIAVCAGTGDVTWDHFEGSQFPIFSMQSL